MHYRRGLGSGGGKESPLREQLLEGIEGIHLRMVGNGGDIFQVTI